MVLEEGAGAPKAGVVVGGAPNPVPVPSLFSLLPKVNSVGALANPLFMLPVADPEPNIATFLAGSKLSDESLFEFTLKVKGSSLFTEGVENENGGNDLADPLSPNIKVPVLGAAAMSVLVLVLNVEGEDTSLVESGVLFALKLKGVENLVSLSLLAVAAGAMLLNPNIPKGLTLPSALSIFDPNEGCDLASDSFSLTTATPPLWSLNSAAAELTTLGTAAALLGLSAVFVP